MRGEHGAREQGAGEHGSREQRAGEGVRMAADGLVWRAVLAALAAGLLVAGGGCDGLGLSRVEGPGKEGWAV